MAKNIWAFVWVCGLMLMAMVPSLAQGKQEIYKALGGKNAAAVETQLKGLSLSVSSMEKEAFEGALLMRKAGFQTVPAKKLATFKQGHRKLEKSIAAFPKNPEYRFLRLMIQENAPRALGYHKNILEDSKLIKENYNTLPVITQKSLAEYSKQSKVLAGAF